ncbi:hypothetical protein HY504_01610 [Candidatus Wolfebacteria bacterium]|nr:hypothetical protein [Candidatus Wolfebacteria bacterium]
MKSGREKYQAAQLSPKERAALKRLDGFWPKAREIFSIILEKAPSPVVLGTFVPEERKVCMIGTLGNLSPDAIKVLLARINQVIKVNGFSIRVWGECRPGNMRNRIEHPVGQIAAPFVAGIVDTRKPLAKEGAV